MAGRLNSKMELKALQGKRIALLMPKCIENYVATLLIWRLGASIVVCRPPVFDEKAQKWLWNDFDKILSGEEDPNWKVDLIIGHSRFESVIAKNKKLKEITFYADLSDASGAEQRPGRIPDVYVDPKIEAYTVFTSGTTGRPKGAINSSEGFPSRNESHIDILELNEDSVVAQDRPLYIDASLQEMMMTWAVGGHLEVVPEGLSDWQAYIQFFNTRKITHAIVVPSILKQIYAQYKNSATSPFATLNYILTTGESMSPEIYDQFHKWKLIMVNGFGPSEFTIGAMLWRYTQDKGVSIGTPMPGVNAFIVETNDDGVVLNNNTVNLKQEGQLLLTGVGVGLGYSNNPDLTKERFRYFKASTNELFDTPTPGATPCYLTGDKVSLKNGLYYIHGRYDRQLKIHSKVLMPEEIEEAIKELKDVEVAQVDVLQHSEGDETYHLIAGIKFKQGKSIKFEDIQEHLRQRLSADKIPTLWQEFKATREGKDAKWKTAPLFKKPIDPTGFKVAGANQTPKIQTVNDEDNTILARVTWVFQSVLPRADLFPHIEFQFLGGSSLLSMNLSGKLRQEFGIMFIAGKLLNKSINDVARQVESQIKKVELVYLNEAECKHHAEPKKNLPIFFIHALLGEASNDYDRFAEFFSKRALYGISAKSANQSGDLNEYAQYYKTAIQDKFEELLGKEEGGPYILVGWSSGGVIAHAVCELLRKEGHDVGLFMLDSTSSQTLLAMTPAEHKRYAITLAKLTGRFLAGMMKKHGDEIYNRYKTKVEKIKLSDDLGKEEQIDSAFRQLDNINEDFKKPEMPQMMEDYYKHAKIIQDAWSIALGVIRYKDIDCKPEERKEKSPMHDRDIGKRYCRLFYAQKDKPEELGHDVKPSLGWTINDDQITTLDGTHLSIMKKSEEEHPPEFKMLVTTLQQEFDMINKKWSAEEQQQTSDASHNPGSGPSAGSTTINSIISGDAKIENNMTADVITIGPSSAPSRINDTTARYHELINNNNNNNNNNNTTITSTISGNVNIKNNYTAKTLTINRNK